MRFSQIALLAGIGALAAAGIANAASADTHAMTIELPNGQVEHILYTGNVAPTVTLEPVFVPAPAALPTDPFVMLRQISAAMDAQAAAMLRDVAAMPFPGGMAPVTVAAGPGVCMRSVQITYSGQGQPQMLSRTSGDCGTAPHTMSPAALPPAPVPAAPAAKTYQVRYEPPAPYQTLIHPVSTLTR